MYTYMGPVIKIQAISNTFVLGCLKFFGHSNTLEFTYNDSFVNDQRNILTAFCFLRLI